MRHSIRKYAVEESRLIEDIGSADMVQAFGKKASEMEKKSRDLIIETSGVQPSITHEETQDYLQKVLAEIKGVSIVVKK